MIKIRKIGALHLTFCSRCILIALSLIIISSLLITVRKQVQADEGYISSANWPILFVHGYGGNSSVDCRNTWASTESFLRRSHDVSGQQIAWTGQFVTLGFYDNDQNCDDSLLNDDYAITQCYDYHNESFGDTNESLRHLGCMLAWYI